MSVQTAAVQTLTAEVRVLVVGSRQVTLSVFRQLDEVDWNECDPFGRVRDANRNSFKPEVVGRSVWTGALVRARFTKEFPEWTLEDERELRRLKQIVDSESYPEADRATAAERYRGLVDYRENLAQYQARYRRDLAAAQALPLIVLAGLK